MSATVFQVGKQASSGVGDAKLTAQIAFTGAIGTENPSVNTLDNPNSPCSQFIVDLAIGDNTIAIPARAGFIKFDCPAGCSAVLKTKNVGGDSGQPFAGMFCRGLTIAGRTEPSSIIVNSDSVVAGCSVVIG